MSEEKYSRQKLNGQFFPVAVKYKMNLLFTSSFIVI